MPRISNGTNNSFSGEVFIEPDTLTQLGSLNITGNTAILDIGSSGTTNASIAVISDVALGSAQLGLVSSISGSSTLSCSTTSNSAGRPEVKLEISDTSTEYLLSVDTTLASQPLNLDYVDTTGVFTGTALAVNGNGQLTYPSQTSFTAEQTVQQVNVTGDGTAEPVIYNSALTNVGSAYNNATGVFTVPVGAAGTYIFTATVYLSGITAQTGMHMYFTVNAAVYYFAFGSSVNLNQGGEIILSGSITKSLAVGDTVTVISKVDGGTKTVSFNNASIQPVTFSGRLLG